MLLLSSFLRRRSIGRIHSRPYKLYSTDVSPPVRFPLSHPTYIIWGSNTSLGKTLVSTGLASSFLLSPTPPPHSSTTSNTTNQRRKFLYLKPVQTGFPSDSDSNFVLTKLSSLASCCSNPFSLIASNSVIKSSLSAAESVGGHFETNEYKFGMYNLNFRRKNSVIKEGAEVSELICKTLYAWKEAVSPHLAAERENGVVEDSEVVEMLEQSLRKELEVDSINERMDCFCVVETAGGVASPGPSGTLQCDLYR